MVRTDDCVFKHVTLKGKFDTWLVEEESRREPSCEEFYRDVDWALDIREAEFKDFDLRGAPFELVRRDPATQVVVTRAAALAQPESRNVPYYGLSIGRMIDSGPEAMLMVAAKRAKNYDLQLQGIQALKDLKLAE